MLLPLKHLANRLSSYSKHCDEETACGSQWTVFDVVVSRLPSCVTVRRCPTLPTRCVSAARVAGSNTGVKLTSTTSGQLKISCFYSMYKHGWTVGGVFSDWGGILDA